jgi:uncharacterized protein YkwD
MALRAPLALLGCSLAAAALLVPASALANRTTEVASFDASLLARLNEVRAAHGLIPLVLSKQLSKAAEEHSRDMVTKGYFAHESADGSSFSKRIKRVYRSGPKGYWSAGENLYWSSGMPDPAAGIAAWMKSPGHRANILNPAWREIGIGTTIVDHAPGSFAGHAATVITTDFGVHG